MKLRIAAIAVLSLLATGAHANMEALLLLLTNRNGQSASVYHGDNVSAANIAFTIKDNGKVYRGDGRGATVFDVAYTIRNGRIYKGDSTSSWDVLYTVTDGRIYEKEGTFASVFDALYTVSGTRIYKGNSTSSWEVVYTFKDGKLYRGDAPHTPSDVLFTIKEK